MHQSFFLLPPAECLLCLALTRDPLICPDCAQNSPGYASDQLWIRRALDKQGRNADLNIASFWPYVWPLAAVQHRCKFNRWRLGGRMLARLAARRFMELQPMDPTRFVLVPSPMYWTRRMARGGNHALIQGEQFAGALKLPCRPGWLRRVQSRPQQVGLPRRKRLHNLRRAFAASAAVAGQRILLFDDIVTTGATMRHMAQALYSKGAEEVVGISLMRVD